MTDDEAPTVYIDTNALRSMGMNTHLSGLLAAAKEGRIKLFISEAAIWERARQYYDEANTKIVTVEALLPRVCAWFIQLFENHQASILRMESTQDSEIQKLLDDENFYFSKDDPNDLRDALIFLLAQKNIDRKNSIILCAETSLATLFEKDGYSVRKDGNKFIDELWAGKSFPIVSRPKIQAIPEYDVVRALSEPFRDFLQRADKSFIHYERELPVLQDALKGRLASIKAQDEDLSVRILGHTQWFAPLTKTGLEELLQDKRYPAGLIANNAERLRLDGLLIDTGKHWLVNLENPDSKQICDQAMAAAMPEILERLGLT